jgi:hypothetical protein
MTDTTKEPAKVLQLVHTRKDAPAAKQETTPGTPRALLEAALEEADNTEAIFLVRLSKDGDWTSGWSRTTNGNLVYALKVFELNTNETIYHVEQEPTEAPE